jgi:superfamily II DNA or RNA helicase
LILKIIEYHQKKVPPEPILVFVELIAQIVEIISYLKSQGMNDSKNFRYDGGNLGSSVGLREEEIGAFKAGKDHILFLSKMGEVGLDLPEACAAILVSPDWSANATFQKI